MSKGPLTEIEREYVRSKFPQLSVAEIAKKLDRSRVCVNNVVRKESLRKTSKCSSRKIIKTDAGTDDALTLLCELRDTLRGALEDADPRGLPGLAREYRATIERIETMGGGNGDGTANALDAIAQSIASRMSS